MSSDVNRDADVCEQRMADGRRDAVVRFAECVCNLSEYRWPIVDQHAAEIDQHWEKATALNSTYFDGIVLLTSACRVEMLNSQLARLELTLFATRFRNFLFWRHHGFMGEGAIDGFGAAIIRSGDGAILLVRQRPGNVNEGPFNFPCGFIDMSDVEGDGRVNLAANVAREVAEEVGLAGVELERCPGFLVTRIGVHLAVGIEFHSKLSADVLAGRIRNFISSEKNPEIAEVVFVHSLRQADDLQLAPHCRPLLQALLGSQTA